MGSDTFDRLIPPPWPRTRRLAAATVVVAMAAGIGALWWIGALGPNVGPVRGYGYGLLDGTDDTVEVQLDMENRGFFAVTDVELREPPMVGARIEQPAAPFTLPPRSTTTITFHLVVESCERMQVPAEPMLAYTGRSALVVQHGRSLSISGATGSPPTWTPAAEPEARSWWYEVAQPVCDVQGFRDPA